MLDVVAPALVAAQAIGRFIPRVLGRVRAGTIFFTYLAAYAAGRLVLESMRVDFAHRLMGLRVNQWVFGATWQWQVWEQGSYAPLVHRRPPVSSLAQSPARE